MAKESDAMHVSHIVSRRGEKEYNSYLVRRTYGENGKVKHETLANVSKLPLSAIEALKLVLAKKPVIEAGSDFSITTSLWSGPGIGDSWSQISGADCELCRSSSRFSNIFVI